jgi:hypothetical protein
MKWMTLSGNLKMKNIYDQSGPKHASVMFDNFIAGKRANCKKNSVI